MNSHEEYHCNSAEITIAAGELESAEVTWTITDDFLLTTAGEESHTLVVTASAESEDPVVKVNSKENFLTFNVDKVLRNFKYLSVIGSNWTELSKAGLECGDSFWCLR